MTCSARQTFRRMPIGASTLCERSKISRLPAFRSAIFSISFGPWCSSNRRQLVPTATNLEALAEESYRAGRTSVLGVLDAQRSLRDLSREALQAALDLQLSLADLEELLGTPLP